VIAIQHEELVMVERSGLPAFRAVALFATHAEIAMNVVLWSVVASLAAIPCSCTQQRMRERVLAAQSELPSLVIAVAGHAILLDWPLVESRLNGRLGNWHAFGRAQSDIWHCVTGDASLRDRAAKGCVAGETVLRETVPSFSRPPLEFCFGTRPIHAEKSRPERKAFGSATLATSAVASAGPTPGMASSRLQVSFDRCQSTRRRSRMRI
jgi:hypothetical protein